MLVCVAATAPTAAGRGGSGGARPSGHGSLGEGSHGAFPVVAVSAGHGWGASLESLPNHSEEGLYVFNSLSDRHTATFKNLRGKGRLSEADVDATIREIRRALLDADVALPVVRAFTGRIRERALSEEVSAALNPGQQVVKIVNDELVGI